MTSLVRDVMTTDVMTVEPWTPFRRSRLIPSLVRAVHAVEGVVRVEDRLTSDVDDRDADLAMTYPFMRIRT